MTSFERLALCTAMAWALISCGDPALSAGLAAPPSPELSAGIFIGVEQFSYDSSLSDVRYATNDAIDLAHVLTFERRLLLPKHVLLLLAGKPGAVSLERLEELTAAGASQQPAKQADIYSLIQKQSGLVREGGILVIFIATHGFSERDEHLLLAEDSILNFRTGVTAERLLQAAQADFGGLRLVLIDACREQLIKPSRRDPRAGAKADPRSAMRRELLGSIAANAGYAVFSAASAGGFAYDADGNGHFTKSLVEGLGCRSVKTRRRVETLFDLGSWVTVKVAIQTSGQQQPDWRIGGGFSDFALPACGAVPPRPSSPPALADDVLQSIRQARNLAATGGAANVEESFRIYRQVFRELPSAVLATLNQALVARAKELEADSRADEGVRIYQQVLEPLLRKEDLR